jgi:hypothetical protein
VIAEKLDEISFRLEISETGRLATAVARVTLVATQSLTDTGDELVELLELFEEAEAVATDIAFKVLLSAIVTCATCCKLPELSAVTMLFVGLLLSKPLTRPIHTDEFTLTATAWPIQKVVTPPTLLVIRTKSVAFPLAS